MFIWMIWSQWLVPAFLSYIEWIETLENVFIKQGDILLESSSIHFKTRILLMKGIRLLCIHHLKLVYEEHKIILSPYSFSSSKPQDQVELPDSLLDFLSTSVSILLSQLQENVYSSSYHHE